MSREHAGRRAQHSSSRAQEQQHSSAHTHTRAAGAACTVCVLAAFVSACLVLGVRVWPECGSTQLRLRRTDHQQTALPTTDYIYMTILYSIESFFSFTTFANYDPHPSAQWCQP
jgi:hypothetical protein